MCLKYLRNYHLILCSLSLTLAWSPVSLNSNANQSRNRIQRNAISPYVDLVLCPIREEPWSCARQQSARILDVWDGQIYTEWQKLKVEADRELNATFEKRGYSGSEVLTKEKPSTILKKIELGTNYMKEYLSKTMDGFLGYEYEHLERKNDGNEDENVTEEQVNESESENLQEDGTAGDEEEEEDGEYESERDAHVVKNSIDTKNDVVGQTEDEEFVELEDETEEEHADELKHPQDGTERKKEKKRKKNKKGEQPATVVILQQQPVPSGLDYEHTHGHDEPNTHVSKPNKFQHKKQKRQKKRKDKHQLGGAQDHYDDDNDALSTALMGHDSTGSLGLGILEDLLGDGDWLMEGGKRRKGHPANYGRSNGVMRGKKKKKKKAIMKLVLLGSFLKAKIELLLKILGAHLQIKFFAIALIGLLINIARFWIDVKRGSTPQKVVYVEHAHHQHHYEDHGEEWGEPGGYWKRSLPGDSNTDENAATDSYQPQTDAQYMAYRNQWQQ